MAPRESFTKTPEQIGRAEGPARARNVWALNSMSMWPIAGQDKQLAGARLYMCGTSRAKAMRVAGFTLARSGRRSGGLIAARGEEQGFATKHGDECADPAWVMKIGASYCYRSSRAGA